MSLSEKAKRGLEYAEHADFLVTWGLRLVMAFASLGVGKVTTYLIAYFLKLPSDIKQATWLLLSAVLFGTALIGIQKYQHLRGKQIEAHMDSGGQVSTPSGIQVKHSDWVVLGSDFSRLTIPVRADWYGRLTRDNSYDNIRWDFRGGQASECEALCQRGGAMLLKSPKVLSQLSVNVRMQENDAWRWLYFLAADGLTPKEIGTANGITRDGKSVRFTMQSMENVAKVSELMCNRCAAKET